MKADILQSKKDITIEFGLKSKSNNLGIIKFFAATLVLVSHAYPLSLEHNIGDFFFRWNGGGLTLGELAVGIFFFFSGLYVSKSLERSKYAKPFFTARCKGIFPSLIVVIVITVLVGGLFLSNLSLAQYFTTGKTYQYLLNCLLIPVHGLPGVFENNIYPMTVNGALWSLPVEFGCYIGLFLFYKLNFLKKSTTKVFLPIAICAFTVLNFSNIALFETIKWTLNPVFMFYIGMLCYVYRERIRLSRNVFILMIVLYGITCYSKAPIIAQVAFLPYILVYIALGLPQCSSKIAKIGNLSYPLYLVAFPIQQCVSRAFGAEISPQLNIGVSFIFAVLAAMILYSVVERKI